MPEYYMVITSWPDLEGAHNLGKRLLEKNLVASVNVLPEMHSIYKWNGEYRTGNEHQMLLKTTADRLLQIEKEIKDQHPYPLAEIINIAINSGSQEYLHWIAETTR